jgi:hypothetical protein
MDSAGRLRLAAFLLKIIFASTPLSVHYRELAPLTSPPSALCERQFENSGRALRIKALRDAGQLEAAKRRGPFF